jgi:hypothetical protein
VQRAQQNLAMAQQCAEEAQQHAAELRRCDEEDMRRTEEEKKAYQQKLAEALEETVVQAGCPPGELRNKITGSFASASIKWLKVNVHQVSTASAYAHKGAGTARDVQLGLPGAPQIYQLPSTGSASLMEVESGPQAVHVGVLRKSPEEAPDWGCLRGICCSAEDRLCECKKFLELRLAARHAWWRNVACAGCA